MTEHLAELPLQQLALEQRVDARARHEQRRAQRARRAHPLPDVPEGPDQPLTEAEVIRLVLELAAIDGLYGRAFDDFAAMRAGCVESLGDRGDLAAAFSILDHLDDDTLARIAETVKARLAEGGP